MADLLFVLAVVAFFALALAVVAACDRIAPSEPVADDPGDAERARP